jgi:hypothetical protein
MSSLPFSRLLFINDLFALLPRSGLLIYIAPLFGLDSKEGTAQPHKRSVEECHCGKEYLLFGDSFSDDGCCYHSIGGHYRSRFFP